MNWELYSLDKRHINWEDISKDEIVIATIKNQPKISDNLKIGSKIYHVSILDIQKHHVGVHEINFIEGDEVKEALEEDFECPYCGYVYYDAFELQDEGEIKCPNCSSELEYTRITTIEYSVEPVKRAKIKKV
jgi:DNA-directed RNA polymerase subunit RPC12/RpoP